MSLSSGAALAVSRHLSSAVLQRTRALLSSFSLRTVNRSPGIDGYQCFSSLKSASIKMSTEKPNVVFVLGGPGAGKGTQCQKIIETFAYDHLSAGELLREERNRPNSEFGELIESHIKEGSIVPVEITCSLLERAMTNSNKNNFLIDGFPRNEDNLTGWLKQMGEKTNVKFVLFFNCDEDTCVKRCLDRGAAGSGRSDDNMDSLKKRFQTYLNHTMPIVDHFRKKDMVVDIDASKNPEEVFEEVKKHFQ